MCIRDRYLCTLLHEYETEISKSVRVRSQIVKLSATHATTAMFHTHERVVSGQIPAATGTVVLYNTRFRLRGGDCHIVVTTSV